jgi:uncharacterized protein (TIGR02246 family)
MMVRQSAALGALIFLLAFTQSLLAQQGPPKADNAVPQNPESGDRGLDAVRRSADAFVEAFNRGDAKALAQLWTPNGEYVDELGSKSDGREAIEKAYAEFLTAHPKATLRLEIDSLKMLSADAAIEDGSAFLELPGGARAVSQYSVVHIMEDGKWLMASVRDSSMDTGSLPEQIADLQWLIGAWDAEENGVKTRAVCRWLGDKSFVERSYNTTNLDGVESSGVQIIGWNAQRGYVQSWNFSPDGSHAIGIWSPVENGWRADVSGVTADGTATSAVNLLRRLDNNAYMWQSTRRFLGDIALPDTDEVVIRRRSPK